MRTLAPGWALLDGQWVYRVLRGALGSAEYRPVALVDRATGAIYPLVSGISAAMVREVLEGQA